MEAGDNNSSSTANIVAFSWLVSLVIVAAIAYFVGRSSVASSDSQQFASLSPSPTGSGITPPPQQQVAANTNPSLNDICQKSGPSQKKDYLVPYLLKEGDSFATIAEKELGDPTRVSELTALNDDQKQLVVGSTIY